MGGHKEPWGGCITGYQGSPPTTSRPRGRVHWPGQRRASLHSGPLFSLSGKQSQAPPKFVFVCLVEREGTKTTHRRSPGELEGTDLSKYFFTLGERPHLS